MDEIKIESFDSLDGETFKTYESCYCPPILDCDPAEAAKSLTIKDAEEAFEVLSLVYQENSRDTYVLLCNAMYYSLISFNWFRIFYKTINRVHHKGNSVRVAKNFSKELLFI